MDDKLWQPLGAFQSAGVPSMASAVDAAGRLTRRLIPFPGSESADLLPPTIAPLLRDASPQAGAPGDAMAQAPARIVAEAASILDEEMAKGVLSARNLGTPSRALSPDGSQPMLHQVHDFVDQLAAAWPTLQGLYGQPKAAAAWTPSGTEGSAVCELRPRSPVQPGQRATLTMTVSNDEDRAVVVTPMLTDLLGSDGGRIAADTVQVTPREVRLERGARQDVQIAVAIPAAARAGCYSGLLVARGVEDVRALITIEVQ